jgi:hypothetical protein
MAWYKETWCFCWRCRTRHSLNQSGYRISSNCNCSGFKRAIQSRVRVLEGRLNVTDLLHRLEIDPQHFNIAPGELPSQILPLTGGQTALQNRRLPVRKDPQGSPACGSSSRSGRSPRSSSRTVVLKVGSQRPRTKSSVFRQAALFGRGNSTIVEGLSGSDRRNSRWMRLSNHSAFRRRRSISRLVARAPRAGDRASRRRRHSEISARFVFNARRFSDCMSTTLQIFRCIREDGATVMTERGPRNGDFCDSIGGQYLASGSEDLGTANAQHSSTRQWFDCHDLHRRAEYPAQGFRVDAANTGHPLQRHLKELGAKWTDSG